MNKRYFLNGEKYNPVVRHILSVDSWTNEEKRINQPPVYGRDFSSKAYVIPQNGAYPKVSLSHEQIYVPNFKIATNPVITEEEFNHYLLYFPNREEVCKRIIDRAINAMHRQIDLEVFKLFGTTASLDQTINADTLSRETIMLGKALLEAHELKADGIVMHPMRYKDFDAWEDKSDFTETGYSAENAKEDDPPIWAYFKNIKIYVSSMCPTKCVYIIAKPENIGVYLIKDDIEVFDNQDLNSNDKLDEKNINEDSILTYNNKPIQKKNKYGANYLIETDIGLSILNDFSIVRINISSIPKNNDYQKLEQEIQDLKAFCNKLEGYFEKYFKTDNESILQIKQLESQIDDDTIEGIGPI